MNMRTVHPRAVLLPMIGVLALALAACTSGNASPSSSSPSAAASASASGPIQRGGTLTIAIEDDIRAGGNLQAHDVVDNTVYGSTVFDPLFTVSRNGNPAPALATGATPSDGNLTWTFTIRQGVKFTDGKPFNAESVKENLDAFLNAKNASPVAADLADIKSYSVTGPYTIVIQLHTPYAHLPNIFMDNAYMAEMNPYNPNVPVGTGPYEFVSHVVGNELTFKRNPDYWRGEPPLNEVVFKVITTPQLATLDLEKGIVDMVPEYLDATSIDALSKQSGINLYSAKGTDNYQAFFDFQKARTGGYKNAADIRQGLADLIDTQQLVPPLIGSFGTLATQPIPSGEAGYDPSITPWPFNPTEGETLLAEGGIPKGGTISLYAIQRTDLCSVATAFQAQLNSLGYHATLQCLENEVAATVLRNYQWDMFFWHNGEGNLASATFQDIWAITNAPNPPNDIFTLRDPQLQNVINAMVATTDTSQYEKLVQQASQIVVKQQIATIPLYFDTVWIAARSNVHGIVANAQDDYGLLMNAMTTVWKS